MGQNSVLWKTNNSQKGYERNAFEDNGRMFPICLVKKKTKQITKQTIEDNPIFKRIYIRRKLWILTEQ